MSHCRPPTPLAGTAAHGTSAKANIDPGYMSRQFESFERINSIRVTNGNFDSCNSCKWLGTSRLHDLHQSKFSFVTRIEFIRSIFLLMYPGPMPAGADGRLHAVKGSVWRPAPDPTHQTDIRIPCRAGRPVKLPSAEPAGSRAGHTCAL